MRPAFSPASIATSADGRKRTRWTSAGPVSPRWAPGGWRGCRRRARGRVWPRPAGRPKRATSARMRLVVALYLFGALHDHLGGETDGSAPPWRRPSGGRCGRGGRTRPSSRDSPSSRRGAPARSPLAAGELGQKRVRRRAGGVALAGEELDDDRRGRAAAETTERRSAATRGAGRGGASGTLGGIRFGLGPRDISRRPRSPEPVSPSRLRQCGGSGRLARLRQTQCRTRPGYSISTAVSMRHLSSMVRSRPSA